MAGFGESSSGLADAVGQRLHRFRAAGQKIDFVVLRENGEGGHERQSEKNQSFFHASLTIWFEG